MEKLKKLNRIILNKYKSKIIGVDEGLIDLPFQEENKYNMTNVNNKPKPIQKISCSSNNDILSTQNKRTISTFSSLRSSDKNILISNSNDIIQCLSDLNFSKCIIPKTKLTSQTIDTRAMKKELLKLNQCDNKNAINIQKTNNNPTLRTEMYVDTSNLSSLKWFNDIKSDPKQLEKLLGNKYFKDFFNKLDQRHRIFSPKNEVANEKSFHSGMFVQNTKSHKK